MDRVKKKVLFIINPISGKGKQSSIDKEIIEYISADFDCKFSYTEYPKHATELSKNAINEGFSIVVAVGGDGTVNEVARSLINSDVNFAIIPRGSGNGLALHLGIPFSLKKSVEIINKCNIQKIDTIKLNDKYCVNMAGVGFDAHISHVFDTYGKRGLKSYVKLILKEFFKYSEYPYKILIDNNIKEYKSLVISFANSTQFGNNAHIAPLANITDGLIDICIMRKFSILQSIPLAIRLFTKNINKSKHYKLIKTDKLKIINSRKLPMHIDGDPITFESNVQISILPKSLNVIV